jgi:hypothetical protein
MFTGVEYSDIHMDTFTDFAGDKFTDVYRGHKHTDHNSFMRFMGG